MAYSTIITFEKLITDNNSVESFLKENYLKKIIQEYPRPKSEH